MKKKPASKSAFFNPRVLIGFALCLTGLFIALLAFALYPGGNAFARQEGSALPAAAQDSLMVVQGVPAQEQPSAPPVSVTSIDESGTIDMAALGIQATALPLPFRESAGTNPDEAMGSGKAFTGVSNEVVNQSVARAFATLSTGWTPGESVQYYLNGSPRGHLCR